VGTQLRRHHLKLVGNQTIRKLIESFETVEATGPSVIAETIEEIDLTITPNVRHVVTVDGGQALVPNPIRRERTVAFIQVAACLLKVVDLEKIRSDPMMTALGARSTASRECRLSEFQSKIKTTRF
jgi:hypothetical protein